VFADFVMASMERFYPPVKTEDLSPAGAIVILGGVTRGLVPGTRLNDLDGGVDRLFHGARLFSKPLVKTMHFSARLLVYSHS
jgi:hypothetical protein